MALYNNTTIDTTGNSNSSTSLLIELSLWPLRLTCPLLFICCPIANWVCIRVFQSRVYSRSSSKWYFMSIAIFDTIYVIVTVPLIFLLTFKIYILNWNILLCKSIVFFNYLSCQISAGLLACLSIDRLVATTCLSLYRSHCTTKLSRIVCIVVILVFSIVNSHYLIGWTIDSNGHCSMRRYEWYNQNYSRLNVVYLLSYSIIPFSIITICNIFIVLSVCRNKTNFSKKYRSKEKNLPHQQESTLTPSTFDQVIIKTPMNVLGKKDHNEENGSNSTGKYLRFKRYSNEMKKLSTDSSPETLVYINDKQVMNKMTNTNPNWRSNRCDRLSEKLLLVGDEPGAPPPGDCSSFSGKLPINHRHHHSRARSRTSSANSFPSSPSYSQKMCVQLQITISLLAISICFIFCTLPNCISTIMIQTYSEIDPVREIWQAMNYFSIVPLLITHSGNFFVYYLSSHMFRDQFKDVYKRKPRLSKIKTTTTNAL